MSKQPAPSLEVFLGIEGGGTRTVAILADARGRLIARREGPPSNLRLVSDEQLRGILKNLTQGLPAPSAVGVGLAGARDERDNARIRKIAAQIWPHARCVGAHDLETALAAAGENSREAARVIVLSGTGSCCYGSSAKGARAKVGGWGHIIGDKGSGFEIGLRALKAVVYYLDRDGTWSLLGQSILRELLLNQANDLISWVQRADKKQIAALAITVFACQRDPIARDILKGAAHSIARDALTCARRLARKGQIVRFVLAGSVLLKQRSFAKKVAKLIRADWPQARVEPLAQEGAWGGVFLAQRMVGRLAETSAPSAQPASRQNRWIPTASGLSPTEQRNPASMRLGEMPLPDAFKLMLREESKIPRALLACEKELLTLIRTVSKALKTGGRLFYCGAGTSGRLGVLDASECPPTFRSPPEQVQGIMAGGQQALWQAVEGAEDDFGAGEEAARFRGIRKGDVVIGIAASGRTPFVWGCLKAAHSLGAHTALICFNPNLEFRFRPGIVICPRIGPEILTGSTRLKAGTATKQILNLITTLAMVGLGKVVENLMVDVHPSNTKLKERAVRILGELGVKDPAIARELLQRNGWVIKKAWSDAKAVRKRIKR